MKIMNKDYPIFGGTKPRLHAEVKDHIEKSEFHEQYTIALERLLTCYKHRVLRASILDHIWSNSRLQVQLAKIAPEAKMEPCWYAFRGATIGICRASKDMSFVVLAIRDEIISAGGVFLDAEIHDGKHGIDGISLHYDIHTAKDAVNGDISEEQHEAYLKAVAICLGTIVPTFLEFAEVETVVLSAVGDKQRRAKVDGEKYITDILGDVEIVDSGWYRTLVRDGDFGVSGHFRLQPYGPLNSLRKLIWIKDFVKHGYVRKAKIERGKE